jgi:excisionase family DNA binding protein
MGSNAIQKNNESKITISIDISSLKQFIENTILESLEFYVKNNKNFMTDREVVSEDNSLVTIKEACSLLRCSRATIYRYKTQLSLPYVKRGKTVLFYKSDLKNLLTRKSCGVIEDTLLHYSKE